MITVRDILSTKGNVIWSVSPDTSMLDTVKYMTEKNVGALLVKKDEQMVGIISERDFARGIANSGGFQPDAPVSDFMTEEIYTAPLDMSTDKCMQMMTQLHIRHLPVCDGNEMVGIISIGDVVKSVITDQESTIEDLQNYILGRGYGR